MRVIGGRGFVAYSQGVGMVSKVNSSRLTVTQRSSMIWYGVLNEKQITRLVRFVQEVGMTTGI